MTVCHLSSDTAPLSPNTVPVKGVEAEKSVLGCSALYRAVYRG